MAHADQLSSTVAKIYAAVTDVSLWRDALTAVEDFTGSTGAVFHVIPKTQAPPLTLLGAGAASHFPPAELAEWEAEYMPVCPRVAAGRRWPNKPFVVDYMILSESDMDRHPSYDWWDRHGVRYFIGSMMPETPRHTLAWSLQRSRRQGHAQDEDIALFDLVRPHLAQAAALADSLDTLAAHRCFSDAMLDALPQAVFGLDALGSLLFVNASGERLLARGDCLRSAMGRLVTPVTVHQPRLDALIREVVAGGSGGSLRVERITGGPPCAVRVSPIHGDEIERILRPSVLVIVTDPVGAVAVDEDALQALYGLTPAEAHAAVTLLDGHSIHSAAQQLGIAAETMRSHLKSIFRKTGVSRQQDLVRRLIDLEQIASKAASPEQGMVKRRGAGKEESRNADKSF